MKAFMRATLYLFCIYSFCLEASDEAKKTICLNMIVKNETPVIRRCLESVKPIIDYWVIVDTGSTDGTQEMIKEYMKDTPGELHEMPWKNFGYNRNEALKLAKNKADYIIFIDADEVFAFDDGFKMPELDKDFYYIITDYSGMRYGRVQLVNNKLNWEWSGVLHETVGSTEAKSAAVVPGMRDVVHTDGARSTDPQKYHKDAKILEDALKEEPTNTRYVFYLAQSYRDAGEYEKSIENYQKRVDLGGWDQEVFWSMYQIGIMQEILQKPPETFLKTYYETYNYRNTRMEPLYRLANYYRRIGNYAPGYLIAATGLRLPLTQDILFVENWMYDYGMLLEFSICAFWVGRYDEAKQASLALLAKPKLPENVKDCVQKNLAITEVRLSEIATLKNASPKKEATAEKELQEAAK
jgi:glycosyltransferase involved in cell wall biosynthesis